MFYSNRLSVKPTYLLSYLHVSIQNSHLVMVKCWNLYEWWNLYDDHFVKRKGKGKQKESKMKKEATKSKGRKTSGSIHPWSRTSLLLTQRIRPFYKKLAREAFICVFLQRSYFHHDTFLKFFCLIVPLLNSFPSLTCIVLSDFEVSEYKTKTKNLSDCMTSNFLSHRSFF